MHKIKIGVLAEEKSPPDKRVPLTPLICSEIASKYLTLKLLFNRVKLVIIQMMNTQLLVLLYKKMLAIAIC